ncbi:hypothetical protein G6011_11029 [Alternaria panax]|uniref:Uncharacterized protein n=1 Tax=Alternaria panax TaxID=48097 RepID=A0AAD4NSX0_9PLEO|nr:hypothetical protein G6011_11029 [Alternaria panax]
MGFGVSIAVETLLEDKLDMVGVEIDVDEGIRGLEVDQADVVVGAGVDDDGVAVGEDDDFDALLELQLVAGATVVKTVAVTSRVTVSPGPTTSTVFVVSTTEVAVAGPGVDESPPTLTTE